MASFDNASDREVILDRPGTLAGFTKAEWVKSLALTMNIVEAEETVAPMFAARSDGSSGFAFPVEQWAFLSLVDRDCERRVRIITRGYGEDFATELTELIDSYRKLAEAGQLRPLWDAARKAYLAGDDAALAKLGLNRG